MCSNRHVLSIQAHSNCVFTSFWASCDLDGMFTSAFNIDNWVGESFICTGLWRALSLKQKHKEFVDSSMWVFLMCVYSTHWTQVCKTALKAYSKHSYCICNGEPTFYRNVTMHDIQEGVAIHQLGKGLLVIEECLVRMVVWCVPLFHVCWILFLS